LKKICIVTVHLAGKYGYNEALEVTGVSRAIEMLESRKKKLLPSTWTAI
jgi:hypothetical protein